MAELEKSEPECVIDEACMTVGPDEFEDVETEETVFDEYIEDIKSVSPKEAETFKIDAEHVSEKAVPLNIDGLDQLEAKSDENYDKNVVNIVEIAKGHLSDQNRDKTNIRKYFMIFFMILLSIQLFSVIAFIAFNATGLLGFEMTDGLIITYITSVFIETLSAIVIMIHFAFDTKDEVEIIKLLTAIVNSYQKYTQNPKYEEK